MLISKWIKRAAVLVSIFAVAESVLADDLASAPSPQMHPYKTGFKVPPKWQNGANFVTQSPFTLKEELPSSYDWRTSAALSPIRNQGNCGSCWAFSTAATFEDSISIKDHQSRDISEQHLVSCDKHGWNCDGGFWAFDMYEEAGAVYESDMRYSGTNGSCPANLPRHEKATNWAYVGTPIGAAPAVADLKRAIVEFGPISVGLNATMSLQMYSGGIFSKCVPTTVNDLNHAVNIVGWDDAGGYWIMRNSWGSSWGDKGYMKIKYGCNGIGSAASYVNYKPTCADQPVAAAGPDQVISAGGSVKIGSPSLEGKDFTWSPADSLDDPTSPTPTASPTVSEIYTVTVRTECGIAASQMEVNIK